MLHVLLRQWNLHVSRVLHLVMPKYRHRGSIQRVTATTRGARVYRGALIASQQRHTNPNGGRHNHNAPNHLRHVIPYVSHYVITTPTIVSLWHALLFHFMP